MNFKASALMAMIVSIALLSISSAFAVAAPFDVQLKAAQEISTCPTITEDAPPLNMDDIPVFIANYNQYPDTFMLTLELPAGWQGFVDPDFIVDAGKTKQLDPIWITVPDVTPGVYDVALKARSGQSGTDIRTPFKIRVLACHSLQLDAVEAYKEVCTEEPEKAMAQIRISNKGTASETLALSVYQSGLPINWASGAPSITVPSGSQTLVNFTFAPPSGLSGEQRFTIKAKSMTSYAEASADVRLSFKDCYSFKVEMQPQEATVCPAETADFKLTVTNNGQADTFSITVPSWIQADKTVALDSNEKKEIKLTAMQSDKGRHTFDAKVASAKSASIAVSGALNVQECRGLAIVVTPENATVCSGNKAAFKVMIKNTGSVEESVDILSDMGVLETSKLTIAAKDVKTIDLVVDTKNFTGKKAVTVAAKSGAAVDSAMAEITSENCYSSTLDAVPSAVKLCACESASIMLTVANTGKLSDTYTLSMAGTAKDVTVEAGKTATINMTIQAPCNASSSFTATATAKSQRTSAQKDIAVTIDKAEDCYAILLFDGNYVEVRTAKSFAMPVHIKNAGKRADTFTFTLAGPAWTYLQPTSLTLAPGTNDSVYIYISPPFNVANGVYEATIKAKSAHTEATHKVSINVTGGTATAANVTTAPTTNVTATNATGNATKPAAGNETKPATNATGNVTKPASNVTANETKPAANVTSNASGGTNVTMGSGGVVLNATVNESELPTAKVIQLEKTTRLIIVAIIVIAVILILLFRFMTLVK